MKPTANKTSRNQPWRQPPTMLAYVMVPLTFTAGLFFLGWLISS